MEAALDEWTPLSAGWGGWKFYVHTTAISLSAEMSMRPTEEGREDRRRRLYLHLTAFLSPPLSDSLSVSPSLKVEHISGRHRTDNSPSLEIDIASELTDALSGLSPWRLHRHKRRRWSTLIWEEKMRKATFQERGTTGQVGQTSDERGRERVTLKKCQFDSNLIRKEGVTAKKLSKLHAKFMVIASNFWAIFCYNSLNHGPILTKFTLFQHNFCRPRFSF